MKFIWQFIYYNGWCKKVKVSVSQFIKTKWLITTVFKNN